MSFRFIWNLTGKCNHNKYHKNLKYKHFMELFLLSHLPWIMSDVWIPADSLSQLIMSSLFFQNGGTSCTQNTFLITWKIYNNWTFFTANSMGYIVNKFENAVLTCHFLTCLRTHTEWRAWAVYRNPSMDR